MTLTVGMLCGMHVGHLYIYMPACGMPYCMCDAVVCVPRYLQAVMPLFTVLLSVIIMKERFTLSVRVTHS